MRPAACLLVALVLACDGGQAVRDAAVDLPIAVKDGAITDAGSDDLAADGAGSEGSDGGVASAALLTATPAHTLIRATVNDYLSIGVEIRNTGGAVSGPLLLSLTGPDADRFDPSVFTANCQSGLLPGSICSIFVSFDTRDVAADPVLGTEVNATLVVADSGPGGGVATADITVMLLVASEGLSILGPPDMGEVALGAAGASLPFIVANTGNADSGPLVVSLSSPEFVKSADTCTGNSLPMAATCSFAVQLLPTSPGAQWAVLTVQSSAKSVVASEFISGTGVGP